MWEWQAQQNYPPRSLHVFFKVWLGWPLRHFQRPQVFYLNTEMFVIKRVLVFLVVAVQRGSTLFWEIVSVSKYWKSLYACKRITTQKLHRKWELGREKSTCVNGTEFWSGASGEKKVKYVSERVLALCSKNIVRSQTFVLGPESVLTALDDVLSDKLTAIF